MIFSAWHEGWRAPPGPTSRMKDARTEPRGGPRAASRPLMVSAIHPRRGRHPRDTCRRHLVFSRGEATRRRDARDRGASRDLRHKPVARRYLRRAPPGPVRVATRARAGSNRRLGDVLRAFRYAIVYGPRRKCPEKSRVDSCTLSHHQRRDDDDLAPICGFCAKTETNVFSPPFVRRRRFPFSVLLLDFFFRLLYLLYMRASPLSPPRPQRTPRFGPG